MEKTTTTAESGIALNKIPVLKLFWKMMSYKPGLYAINCILWSLIHVEPLILGLILKGFFNILVPGEKFALNLISILVITSAYAIGRMVNIYWGANIDNAHRFIMSALLRRNMLEGILKKPGAAAIPCSSGEALNSFRDDARTIEDSISWTLDFIGNVVFVIVAVVIMVNINVTITLLVFTPLAAVVGIVQLLRSRLQKYRKASREATGMVTGAMGEVFSAVQAIKVAGEEENVIRYLEGLNNKRHKLMLRDTLLTQVLSSIFYNTVSIGTGFILLLAAGSMKSGAMTLGELSLFIYYLNFISDFTSFFGSFIANNRQAKVSFARITDLLKENSADTVVKHNSLHLNWRKILAGNIRKTGEAGEQQVNPGKKTETAKVSEDIQVDDENKTEPTTFEELKLENLSFLYPSSGNGIKNINFSIKKDSFTVITGRIGSGKSTLVKVLLGLLTADQGTISWNGNPVTKPDDFFVTPHSAYTPQVPNLVSDSIKNNILMGLPEDKTDITEALYSAVMEEDIKDLEKGIDTVIGPKGVKLSGGQIQRVAVARMFARKADLLVFDDISSALDVETENKLWGRLLKKRPAACLVVSNRRGALKMADQIIVMKDGEIEAVGNLDELLKSCREMKEIWGA